MLRILPSNPHVRRVLDEMLRPNEEERLDPVRLRMLMKII
jgi:hypothetical protein